MTTETINLPPAHRARAQAILGVAVALAIAAGLLWWAKWAPYSAKIDGLSQSRHWGGHSTLSAAGIEAGQAPSWTAAWSFTVDYGQTVWKALLAALLIAAALQSLVRRDWLVRLLSRRTPVTSAMAGGLVSMPSMMCTCCTAPVAVSLKRCGAPTSAVLAYWMGNPLLNPAVLVFLVLVAPWQWVATRLVVGAILVVVGSAIAARWAANRRTASDADADTDANATETESQPQVTFELAGAPTRFGKALTRLALILIPEYFVVVMLIGAFGGWLFPLSSGSTNHLAATGAAVILGTLLVIPTAGEIPLVQGLSAAGFGLGVVGALLITLPAVSLPSMVMVGRALTWRVTVAIAGVVAVAGLIAGLALTAIS
jgi:uncharacterized membrane protein YraQ (UPF0718 family)